MEPDPRSPGGKGFTGLQALLGYVFNQTLAINYYGPLGHMLGVDAFYQRHVRQLRHSGHDRDGAQAVRAPVPAVLLVPGSQSARRDHQRTRRIRAPRSRIRAARNPGVATTGGPSSPLPLSAKAKDANRKSTAGTSGSTNTTSSPAPTGSGGSGSSGSSTPSSSTSTGSSTTPAPTSGSGRAADQPAQDPGRDPVRAGRRCRQQLGLGGQDAGGVVVGRRLVVVERRLAQPGPGPPQLPADAMSNGRRPQQSALGNPGPGRRR